MGITIRSKNYSFDMSYGGFDNFREKVAEMVGEKFYKHYKKLVDGNYLTGKQRKEYFEKYDIETERLVNTGIVSSKVANFCYQPTIQGGIDFYQAKVIYSLINSCDDETSYGYCALSDCTKMKHMKKIFDDCEKDEKIVWY